MTVLFKANHNGLHNSYQAGFTTTQIQDRTGVTEASNGSAGSITTSRNGVNPVPAAYHPLLGNCLQHTLTANMSTGVVGYRQEAYHDNVARNLVDGSEMYFRFDFAVPESFPVSQGNYFLCINQIHTANPNTSPPLEFDIYNGGLYTRGYNWVDKLPNAIRAKCTDVVPGQVYSVVYWVKCSSDNQENRISVWVNGRQVVDNLNPGYSLLDGGATYWKGSTLYADVAITKRFGELSIYQANHMAATALSDVLVAPPPEPEEPDPEPEPEPGVDGVEMPLDFVYTEVQISPTADFAYYTVVGRMTGQGATIATDLDYGSNYWVRGVAVDQAGNRSAPSEPRQGKPEKVVNIDIGDNAIRRQQIVDGEIVNAKIANLAVNDAKIANLNVGKLTAGIMTADVTVAGSFQTSGDVNNQVVMDNQGVHMWQNGVLSVDLNPSGKALFIGEIRTGRSGKRIVVNTSSRFPEIEFHSAGSDSNTCSRIFVDSSQANGNVASLSMTGPDPNRTNTAWGITLAAEYLGLSRFNYTNGTATDFIDLGPGFLNMEVARTKTVRPYIQASASNNSIGLGMKNNTTYFEGFYVFGAEYCEVRSNGAFRVSNNTGSTVQDIVARNMGGSSRNIKKDLIKLPVPALSILRNAPVSSWKYLDEDDDVEYRHVGPMLDDMPDWFSKPPEDESGEDVSEENFLRQLDQSRMYSSSDLAALAMAAVQELDEEMDRIRIANGIVVPVREKRIDPLVR